MTFTPDQVNNFYTWSEGLCGLGTLSIHYYYQFSILIIRLNVNDNQVKYQWSKTDISLALNPIQQRKKSNQITQITSKQND